MALGEMCIRTMELYGASNTLQLKFPLWSRAPCIWLYIFFWKKNKKIKRNWFTISPNFICVALRKFLSDAHSALIPFRRTIIIVCLHRSIEHTHTQNTYQFIPTNSYCAGASLFFHFFFGVLHGYGAEGFELFRRRRRRSICSHTNTEPFFLFYIFIFVHFLCWTLCSTHKFVYYIYVFLRCLLQCSLSLFFSSFGRSFVHAIRVNRECVCVWKM